MLTRTINDVCSVTDTISRGVSPQRVLGDTITITDVVGRRADATRYINDTIWTFGNVKTAVVEFRTRHTTDTFISALAQNTQTHTTDLYMIKPSRIRSIVSLLRKLVEPGQNIGASSVSLLSVSGNAMAPQQFIYTQPVQEVPVGSGFNSTVFVDDPMIKRG